MSDAFSVISGQSIFSRLGGAIKGVLFGILLIPVSVVVLFWNEGRAVKTATSLREGAAAVVAVNAGSVDPANDKKLVHLSGEAATADMLEDTKFAISASALRLSRKVEMFQWKEEKKSETRKKLGGGTETVTDYTYTKTWSNEVIRSGEFQHPEDHKNPEAMLAVPSTVVAAKATLGAFRLPTSVIAKMRGDQKLEIGDGDLQKLGPDLKAKAKLAVGGFYFGKDPAAPEVGDQSVTFEVLKPATFSILARQTGDTLEPYPTKAGREIERVESGNVSAEAMFAHAEAENTALTWVLRVVGTILMAFGFGLIIRPIATVADVIPLLGNFIGAGVGLAALLLAVIVSFVIVAIAWFAVRPLLSGAFIVAAVAWFVFGHRMGLKRKAAVPT